MVQGSPSLAELVVEGCSQAGRQAAGCAGAAIKSPPLLAAFSPTGEPRPPTRSRRRPLPHRTAETQHAIVFTCERVARPFSHAV